jgi:hypothetical protein
VNCLLSNRLLVRDPAGETRRALASLEVAAPDRLPAAPPSFDELHAAFPWFFRKGRVRTWREEMPPDLHILFWRRHGEAMHRLGYRDGEPAWEQPLDAGFAQFFSQHYTQHNQARLKHLASLGLPIGGRTVLEVGAGPGDDTAFYLERGCRVTANGRAARMPGVSPPALPSSHGGARGHEPARCTRRPRFF